jgi:hypothetical protein
LFYKKKKKKKKEKKEKRKEKKGVLQTPIITHRFEVIKAIYFGLHKTAYVTFCIYFLY